MCKLSQQMTSDGLLVDVKVLRNIVVTDGMASVGQLDLLKGDQYY